MDLQMYGPWALIVGGSEGIGAAFARKLSSDGFNLVLVARKPGPLDDLAEELRATGAEVRTLSADLSKPGVLDLVREMTDDVDIGLLIYNAGANNTRGLFVELPEEVTQSVIAINVLGQANFTRHYGAKMYQQRRGGIILAGSIGGYLGSGTLAAYCASKAFSRIFTEALWAESAAFGVDVLHLNVGFTATPAMQRLGMDLTNAEPPDSVAQQALDNIANGPVWIVNTPGNVERVRAVSVVDDRAEVVRSNSIPPREQTGKLAAKQATASSD
ncbi:SDR family NAD(P)-dependent oxidoreductase [Mycolicibacterium moriokaense]|nr:SDR family NAD(P)-dependent oxidoreductase [Mycolicibacterium moriokaense]